MEKLAGVLPSPKSLQRKWLRNDYVSSQVVVDRVKEWAILYSHSKKSEIELAMIADMFIERLNSHGVSVEEFKYAVSCVESETEFFPTIGAILRHVVSIRNKHRDIVVEQRQDYEREKRNRAWAVKDGLEPEPEPFRGQQMIETIATELSHKGIVDLYTARLLISDRGKNDAGQILSLEGNGKEHSRNSRS